MMALGLALGLPYGGVATAPFVGALDSYTSNLSGAYSVGRRLLKNWTTNKLISVVRSSDSAEQDIGFDSTGKLDTTALLAFVGSGTGKIHWVYDQSGNGRDAAFAVASDQPVIVTGGAVAVKDGVYAAAKAANYNSALTINSVDVVSMLGTTSGMLVARHYFDTGITNSARLANGGLSGQTQLWCPFTDNNLYFDYGGSGSGRQSVAAPSGFSNAWHWVTASRASGTQLIRSDGTQLISSSLSVADTSSVAPFYITRAGFRFREIAFWTDGTSYAAKEAALMA